jgi:hypothetical protein
VQFQRGAVIVAANGEGHRHAELFFQTLRCERDILVRETAGPPPDDALDGVFSTAALELLPGDQSCQPLLSVLTHGSYWTLCNGWFLAQGAPSELAEIRQRLSESRLIRAARQMQRRGPAGLAFCQASLWDDDPAVSRVAFDMLVDLRQPVHARGPELLGAWLRTTDRDRLLYNGDLLSRQPVERARQSERLASTTVDPEALTDILATGLTVGGAECRRAAQAGIVARLPIGALDTVRREGRFRFIPHAESEAFLVALVDRLWGELSAHSDPARADCNRAVRVAGEALALAHAGFVPLRSPALSRLEELGGWLVLHPTHALYFRAGPREAVGIALGACLHDSDPAVRREVCNVAYKHLGDYSYREALVGDPAFDAR